MAITATSLKALHPEFSSASASDAFIELKIASAKLRLSASVWGDLYDTAVDLMACHLLAMDPDGRPMRLDPEMRAGKAGLGVTAYGQDLENLKHGVTCGRARLA